MTTHKTLSGATMDGWETIKQWVQHPTVASLQGALIRNASTGAYAIELGGVLTSVPDGWARQQRDNNQGE